MEKHGCDWCRASIEATSLLSLWSSFLPPLTLLPPFPSLPPLLLERYRPEAAEAERGRRPNLLVVLMLVLLL